jgi:uncharacterized membrane protein (DUF4010 family)
MQTESTHFPVSRIALSLIGFVIYPVLPNRYVDPWQLFNPSDAWISVIAIAGIGSVNYVLLRMYNTRGLYLSQRAFWRPGQ